MESNGKRVDKEGNILGYETAVVVFGVKLIFRNLEQTDSILSISYYIRFLFNLHHWPVVEKAQRAKTAQR
jgi:hypothetical protein